MAKGKISVETENIFPIIKKFLYSDQEIFLRELIANAVDATSKLKTLASRDEVKGEVGDTKIEIILDKPAKTITIRDQGIGMTEAEVEKYLNQVAFSSAEDFIKKYKILQDKTTLAKVPSTSELIDWLKLVLHTLNKKDNNKSFEDLIDDKGLQTLALKLM